MAFDNGIMAIDLTRQKKANVPVNPRNNRYRVELPLRDSCPRASKGKRISPPSTNRKNAIGTEPIDGEINLMQISPRA